MTTELRKLPSVDEVLKTESARLAIDRFGRASTLGAVRVTLDGVRAGNADGRRPCLSE